MKKLLFVLVSLVATPSYAEVLPSGCYVTDQERSTYYTEPVCYVSSGRFSFYRPPAVSAADVNYLYGDITGGLILQTFYADSANFDLLKTKKKQSSLISRLRNKCGKKCKDIK